MQAEKEKAWEQSYKRSWDVLENENGSLEKLVASLQLKRKKRRCVTVI
jgi:hypothetical protein